MSSDSTHRVSGGGGLRARLELTRSWNCGVVFGGVLLGAALAHGGVPRSPAVYLAALGASLITGAGNALNDVYDVDVDRVNKPERVIPSGRVGLPRARREAHAMFGVGLLLSAVNLWTLLMALLNALLLAYYARASKRMLGTSNVTVAYLVASVFPYGALAGLGIALLPGGLERALAPDLLVVTLCAFLVGFSLEVVKDIEDIPGDSKAGARTLPLAWGPAPSRNLAIATTLGAVALSPLPGLWDLHWVYYPVVAAADFFFLASYTRPPSEGRKAISLGMGLVLLALLLGVLLR
ncbi:MAG: UbiA family prenyltransferase [Euryarchaeota archaeon]|nr:UbiA family prenyltransferase [Euryarchaeota archaeon]